MPIKFRCPNCRVRLSISRRKSGTKSECPRCFQALIVPDDPNNSSRSTNSSSSTKPTRKKQRKSETVKASVGGDVVERSNIAAACIGPALKQTKGDTKPESPLKRPTDHVARSLAELAESEFDQHEEDPDRRYEFDPTNYPAFPPELDQLTEEHNKAIPTGFVDEEPVIKGAMQVSRWIVYVQASLLGVVAATFFMFGLMVGNFTAAPKATGEATIAARVSGHIYYTRGDQQYGDEGAVVLLMPADRVPVERLDPESISPRTFEALENPSRERLESIGGAVVRVEADGSFKASIQGPGKFWMLVISNAQKVGTEHELSKEQVANLGSYVYPLDSLTSGRAYQYKEFTVKSSTREISDIVF